MLFMHASQKKAALLQGPLGHYELPRTSQLGCFGAPTLKLQSKNKNTLATPSCPLPFHLPPYSAYHDFEALVFK